MKSINIIDQINASRKIYAKKIEEIEFDRRLLAARIVRGAGEQQMDAA